MKKYIIDEVKDLSKRVKDLENSSPTIKKECICPVHIKCEHSRGHCQPSEEKECTCFRPFHNSVEGIIHQKDCPLIAPKQEEWEELKDILKINILEVSYTQSQENFIDDIKSFISQLLKKEREKVIEEIDSWLKKDSEGTWELEGLYMRFKDYLRKLKK